MAVHAYPVRVEAHLDDRLSRGLWLVKWLLVLPHYFVLAFLWLAFAVLSVVAFVAILFTGRYPRTLFDFNVGVLRWSWRVAYYAYGGLGTDRYPPFSLDDRPDYPARLEIDYPDHLSRGLVLVKWWLLALPHYLVIGFFLGGTWAVTTNDEWRSAPYGGGLISLLVLIAAVALLFSGRYPRSLFDLVLGLNRWVLRVTAYAALMTDDYPPFRLDLGGTDPGGPVLAMSAPVSAPASGSGSAADQSAGAVPPPPPTTGPATPPPPPPPAAPTRFGVGRVLAIVAGALLMMASLGVVGLGGLTWAADSALRDDDGYLTTDDVRVQSPGYAVVTEEIVLRDGVAAVDLPERWLGEVKVEATAQQPEGVFVGIGPSADVERYLDGVAQSQLSDEWDSDGDPVTDFTDGGSPPAAPTDQDFWVASAEGTGTQAAYWTPEDGSWTLVVMNGEGTTPVEADVAVGAEVPILDDLALGLLVGGLAGMALSAGVLWLALRRR